MILESAMRVSVGLLVVLGVATASFHRIRASRLGGPLQHEARPSLWLIPVRIVALAIVTSVVLFVTTPHLVAWAALPIPDWLRLAGATLAFVALAGIHWMFRHLGTNLTRTTTPREGASLVTTGPYRWIRHPLYAFGMLFWIGLMLSTTSWMVAIGVIIGVTFLPIRCRSEETRLIATFGDAYTEYQSRTGRLIPQRRTVGP